MLETAFFITMACFIGTALFMVGKQFLWLPRRFSKQLAKIADLRPKLAGLASRDAYMNDKALLDSERRKHRHATEQLNRAERNGKSSKN